jgi:hypothetical protein
VADVVVTVPKALWSEWLGEGDLAYSEHLPEGPYGAVVLNPPRPWEGFNEYGFNVGHRRPAIERGERLYIVSHGRLRGYSPVVGVEQTLRFGGRNHGNWAIVRRGDAVAVTVPWEMRGFQGYHYRTWAYNDEVPFPNWRTEGVI